MREGIIRDERRPGHFWADNEIIDIYGQKLGVFGVAVYAVLSRIAWNGECKTTLRQIADKISISPQSAMRGLQVLMELGLVEQRKKSTRPEDGPSVYALIQVPKACSYRERENEVGVPIGNSSVPTGNKPVPIGNTNKTINTNKTKPSSLLAKAEKKASLHLELKQLIQDLYNANTDKECPWGPADAAQLKRLIDENPTWVVDDYHKALRNWFATDWASKTAPPRKFLSRLPELLQAPQDRHRNPKHGLTVPGKESLSPAEKVRRQLESA